MKYTLITTKHFEKDLRRCIKRGYDMRLMKEAIELLEASGALPAKYKAHKLSGQFAGCWECHLQADWLLIWQQDDEKLVLLFTNTGTHSDLF